MERSADGDIRRVLCAATEMSVRKRVALMDTGSFRGEAFKSLIGLYSGEFIVEKHEVGDMSVHATSFDCFVVFADSASGHDLRKARQEQASIRRCFEAAAVVIVGGADLLPIARDLIKSGFAGAISTSLNVELVIAALRLICAGGTFITRHALHDYSVERQDKIRDFQALTHREREILALVRHGKQNKIIAHDLGIAENTVKVHLTKIMRKIGASNRTEAAFVSKDFTDHFGQRLSGVTGDFAFA